MDGQVFKADEQTKCLLASNTPFNILIYWKLWASMLSIQLFLNFCTKCGWGWVGDREKHSLSALPPKFESGRHVCPLLLAHMPLQSEHIILYPNTYSRSSWNQIIVSCQSTRHRCPLQFPHMVKPYGIFQIDAF